MRLESGKQFKSDLCSLRRVLLQMGLHGSISATCTTTQDQYAIGVDFRDHVVISWVVQFLREHGLTQDVVDSLAKCANTPTAWEGADGYDY